MPTYPASGAWFQLGGIDLTAKDLKGITDSTTSEMEDTTPIGPAGTNRRRTPTDTVDGVIEQEQAYFDHETHTIHDKLPSGPGSPPQVCLWGYSGQTVGALFKGCSEVWVATYRAISNVAELIKAQATYSVSAIIEQGQLLQPAAYQTASWDTESTPVDNGASSANGGTGYLSVEEMDSFTALDAEIVHSTDDITYAGLIAFISVTADETAKAVAVIGTVNQYVASSTTLTGSPTGDGARATIGFVRNP